MGRRHAKEGSVEYVRATARTKRYRADPGSIYDYDPTEYDTESETGSVVGRKRRTRPAERKSFADHAQEADLETDFDYEALANYRKNMPSDQGQNTHSWMNYLQGEYKRVAPATSINREREVLQEANALADLSKDQVARATEIAR